MKTHRRILIVVLMLTLGLPITPVSAAPSASIRLTSPTPNPGLIGSDINFALVIDVAELDPGLAGVEIYLAYDPALVEPRPSPLGVVEALPDFFGGSNITIAEVLTASQCPGATRPCIHLVAAGPAQTTHSGAAARFHFLGKAKGTASFSMLASTMKNADGYPVNHSPASPISVEIVFRVTVRGKVLRQGVPANPNLGGGTLACSMVSIDPPVVGPVFTNSAGVFELPSLPTGTYKLVADYSGYLASEITIIISESSPLIFSVGTTTLRGGDVNDFNDVNGDGKINILDVGEIISEFQTTNASVGSSDPANCHGPDESPDINDDGSMNISDLAIAAGNWGRTEPTSWP